MTTVFRNTVRHALNRLRATSFRMQRALGLLKADKSPLHLIARHFSDRHLDIMECLWQMAAKSPLRALVPDSICDTLNELARGIGFTNLTCVPFRKSTVEQHDAVDAIVLMGELMQNLPPLFARRILDQWQLVHVNDPMVVLAVPSRGDIPSTPGVASKETSREFQVLRHVLEELEQLKSQDMMIPSAFGARIRCRYDLFDIKAMYEIQNEYFARLSLRPVDVIVDIGAHIGGFSVPCGIQSSPASGGKVIAYEPSTSNHAQLVENIERNCPGKVKAIPMAIFKHRCKLPFHVDGNHSTANSLYNKPIANQTSLVECVGLSDVIEEAGGDIDVLKIDAEGAEYDFLFGKTELLRKHVRSVIAEAHIHGGHTGVDMVKFLIDAGYKTVAQGPAHSMIVHAVR